MYLNYSNDVFFWLCVLFFMFDRLQCFHNTMLDVQSPVVLPSGDKILQHREREVFYMWGLFGVNRGKIWVSQRANIRRREQRRERCRRKVTAQQRTVWLMGELCEMQRTERRWKQGERKISLHFWRVINDTGDCLKWSWPSIPWKRSSASSALALRLAASQVYGQKYRKWCRMEKMYVKVLIEKKNGICAL